jgi:hypothetical protein
VKATPGRCYASGLPCSHSPVRGRGTFERYADGIVWHSRTHIFLPSLGRWFTKLDFFHFQVNDKSPSIMSDETPVTPPSTALYPVLVTPPESGNSIENPILISESDGSDASDTEALRGSARQLSDNSPSPSPRRADRLQPQKLRRHSRYVTPSRGDANVKQLDEVENTRESDINISDLGGDPSLSQVII